MAPLTRATLPLAVVNALQAAGATEEMIAAASGAFGTWENVPRAQAAARQRARRARMMSNVTLLRPAAISITSAWNNVPVAQWPSPEISHHRVVLLRLCRAAALT